MKKLLLISLVSVMLLTGCSLTGEKAPDIKINNDNNTDTVATTDSVTIQEKTEAEGPMEEQYDNNLTFADLGKLEFYFSSGAGGWGTTVNIYADGSFRGSYGDSDMGDTGYDYPNGTYYKCEFAGHFGELRRVDEYTFVADVIDIDYDRTDKTEIIDGVRTINAEPYGMDDAKEVYFYLPGTPVSSLDQELVDWIYWGLYDWETQTMAKELNFIAMYNKNAKEGFSSY